jgi:hypothetical protein
MASGEEQRIFDRRGWQTEIATVEGDALPNG